MLSNREFFFYNPFATIPIWLGFLQLVSMIGWASFVFIGPSIVITQPKARLASHVFLISVSIWPASIVAIQAALWLYLGDPMFSYLVTSPMFFFTDLVSPLIYWGFFRLGFFRFDGTSLAAPVGK